MTVTLQLPPDIEAGLLNQAAALGLPLAKYVEQVLRDQVPVGGRVSLPPAERAAAWRDSVKDLPRTPPLADEAISRESIYRDRG